MRGPDTPLAWAVFIGGVGLGAGVLIPMILAPSSGNGPLLGIFITGPAGFVVGLLWGLWKKREKVR